MNLSGQILAMLNENPGLSDREITDRIKGKHKHPSQINQECRRLEGAGKLTRQRRSDGLIGNYPSGVAPPLIGVGPPLVSESSDGPSEGAAAGRL
jgi:hypothetical protein